jgi:hypothetical protein
MFSFYRWRKKKLFFLPRKALQTLGMRPKIVKFMQNVQYVGHRSCASLSGDDWSERLTRVQLETAGWIAFVIKLSAMYPLDRLQKNTSLPNRIYYLDVFKERAYIHKIYAIITQKFSCKQKSNIIVAGKIRKKIMLRANQTPIIPANIRSTIFCLPIYYHLKKIPHTNYYNFSFFVKKFGLGWSTKMQEKIA